MQHPWIQSSSGFCIDVENGATTYRRGLVRRAASRSKRKFELEPREECAATDVLVELDRACRHREIAPWVPLVAVFLIYVAMVGVLGVGLGPLMIGLAAVLALGASAAIYVTAVRYDRARTTIYVAYALDEEMAGRFALIQSATKALASCRRVWHVPIEARDAERAVRGRAKYVLRKYQIRPDLGAPPRMRANLRVPMLYSEKRKYFFFPDRVLVYDGRRVHAIPYATLELRAGERRCIEDEDLPIDARVVETTWLHSLADGAPDPRFPTNRRCPVALYGELELSGPGNVHELFQSSRADAVREFLHAVEALAGVADWSDAEEGADTEWSDEPHDGGDEPSRDELYEEVLRSVVRDERADPSRVAERLGIDAVRIDAIFAAMERDGFLGGPGANGLRAVKWSATRYVAAAYGGREARGGERAKRANGSRRRAKPASNGAGRPAPHDVLGVSSTSSQAEIAAAYRRLASIYHPDKVANLAPEFEELAERRMKEINAAYRALRSRR